MNVNRTSAVCSTVASKSLRLVTIAVIPGVTKTKSERQVAPQAVKHQLPSKQKANPQGTVIRVPGAAAIASSCC